MISNNTFKAIKNILKAADVVEYYLGAPDRESGASSFWKSPFRERRY